MFIFYRKPKKDYEKQTAALRFSNLASFYKYIQISVLVVQTFYMWALLM